MNSNTTDKKLRTGVFGGSFNPPHNGHRGLLIYAKEKMKLDRVILIPTGDNPLKEERGNVTAEERLDMLRLFSEGLSYCTIDEREIRRTGKSYTVDTLKELRETMDDEFWFISGSDILYQLEDWKSLEALSRLTHFAVLRRRGVDNTDILKKAEYLSRTYGSVISVIDDVSPVEISSSEIREAFRFGRNVSDYMNGKVYAYIKDNHLYTEESNE